MTSQEKKAKAFDMNTDICKTQAELKAKIEAYQALANEILTEESKPEPPIEE